MRKENVERESEREYRNFQWFEGEERSVFKRVDVVLLGAADELDERKASKGTRRLSVRGRIREDTAERSKGKSKITLPLSWEFLARQADGRKHDRRDRGRSNPRAVDRIVPGLCIVLLN